MLTKKIVFLSAQPDVPYFHWQVEVMIHNFIKHGINPNWIEILWAYDNEPSAELLSLSAKYPYVRFFSYKKTPIDNFGYIPIFNRLNSSNNVVSIFIVSVFIIYQSLVVITD